MAAETIFQQDYEKHLQHLALKGLQPKTIDAYARRVRYIGKYFDDNIRNLFRAAIDRLLCASASYAFTDKGSDTFLRTPVNK